MLHVEGPKRKTNGLSRPSRFTLLNPNRHVDKFLKNLERTSKELPENSACLLKEPTSHALAMRELPHTSKIGDYFNGLIETNIMTDNDGSPYGKIKSFINAAQVRAFYHSLTPEYLEKFYKIVKAFALAIENNPKLKSTMQGMVVEGGEIRVVATSALAITINVLTQLLGIKLSKFYGVSAGGFVAAGQAVRAPNSSIFTNCTETPYETFYGNREELHSWLSFFMREGYSFNTGKHVEVLTSDHLKELDTDLQVLVSEGKKGSLLWPFSFRADSYFLPENLERFGDKGKYDLSLMPTISANLVGLFYWPWDKTFGNCYYQDPFEGMHYLLDPGWDIMQSIPIHKLEEAILNYFQSNDDSELLPFYFILRNKKFNLSDFQDLSKDEFAKLKKEYKEFIGMLRELNGFKNIKGILFDIVQFFANLVDIRNGDPMDRVNAIGVNRAVTQAQCVTRDPNNGSLQLLVANFLKYPQEVKENIICSNIPTKEFALSPFRNPIENFEYPAIDQLYNNFVDEEYIESNGIKGKSPFALYKEDVDKKKEEYNPTQASSQARKIYKLKIKTPHVRTHKT